MAQHDQKLESNVNILRKEFETELKTRNDILNEFDLRRGLQGHNNDIDYVGRHLKNHLRFLSSVDWKNFQMHPVLQEYYPRGFVGDTGIGNDTFLYVETVGRADPDGILNSASITTIILNRLYATESMIQQLRQYENKTGRQAKIVFVLDLEEFTMDSSWLSVLGRQFKVCGKFFSDRYSEILHKIIVVNCPSYIYYVWRIVSTVLPEMTKQKVEICYGDEWKEKLRQYVDPDHLPVYWGGKMMDENGDEMCRSKIIIPPGKIPENLRWRASTDDPSPDQCRQLAVSAGQFEFVDVTVTREDLEWKNGTVVLKWYYTTSGDFSFGVFYRSDETSETENDHNTMDMVYPFFEHLPGPTIVPECAQIECKKAGLYRLRFGNEMGWWYKLNVTLNVQCI